MTEKTDADVLATPESMRAELEFQARFLGAVKRGIEFFGERHQLAHALEELSELAVELARILRFDDVEMNRTGYIDDARREAADVVLCMGTVREILGHAEVDYEVFRKLERYERRLEAFEHGVRNCQQGVMENAPFVHVGGLERRNNFSRPRWWDEQYPDDPNGRLLRAYYQGYRKEAAKIFGPDWRTCVFSWTPAVRIDANPPLQERAAEYDLGTAPGAIATPKFPGGIEPIE